MRITRFHGLFFFFILAAMLPTTALAAFAGRTSSLRFPVWPDSDISPVSVREARLVEFEALVTVRGNIAQYVGSDQYVFEDATSSILVVIPADRWHGLDEVTPDCLVELRGRLLRSPTKVRIVVAKVVKLR